MNHIKSIFIFFISLNSFLFYTQQASQIESIATTEESNELDSWNKHLKELTLKGSNWVVDNNVPTDTWTTQALDLAETAIKSNNTLSDELKNSFSNAIKEKITLENGSFTLSPEILIEKFDKKIDELKNSLIQDSSTEVITPITQESKTESLTITNQEKVSIDQPEPAAEITETPSVINEIQPEIQEKTVEKTDVSPETKKEDEKPQEKKEFLIQEWTECLNSMQRSTNNLYELIIKAIEVAQKIENSRQIDTQTLLSMFEKSLEGALAVRGLPISTKDAYLSTFAQGIGIYIPEKIITPHNQPDMQKLQEEAFKQKERALEEERKAIQKREMTIQAAMQAATKLTQEKTDFNTWRIRQENLRIAEEKKLKQLQKDAELLKSDLEKTLAQQKKDADKSLLTRAKETVTSFIWGSSNNGSMAEASITQKKKNLEQLQKQIVQEESALYQQACQINKQRARAEKIKELTGQELTRIEITRKAELEAEQKKCAEIAAKKQFEQQRKEWHDFLKKLAENKQATIQDNEKATIEAIKKAASLLELIPLFSPSKYIIEVEKGLKIAFANALLDQQRGNPLSLNIFKHQSQFDHAINDVKIALIKIKEEQL